MSEHDEPAEIRDEDIRPLQVLQGALGVMPVTFWAVVGVLSQTMPPAAEAPAPEQVQMIGLLSGVHALGALTSWTAGLFLYERTLGSNRSAPPLARLRAATILRLALFEGVALLGGVVCFLAVMQGVAALYPLVWLNAVSLFVLIALVITTFPTRERVERLLRARA